MAQLVQSPPAMQETLVGFLDQEDLLEKGKSTHSSILGLPLWINWLRIHLQCGRPGSDPWVGKIPQRRERLPTPVFWPGEFHGLCSSWGHKESDTTEWLSLSLFRIRKLWCRNPESKHFPRASLQEAFDQEALDLLSHHLGHLTQHPAPVPGSVCFPQVEVWLISSVNQILTGTTPGVCFPGHQGQIKT